MSEIISISELKIMLEDKKSKIPSVNYTNIVIDDSQLAELVDEISADDNFLLIGVVPDYTSDTREDEEAFMLRNETEILVLKKTDYSSYSHNTFLDMMDEVLMVADKLRELLIQDKYEGTGCGKMFYLNEQSIQITPVWRKAECNGWMLSFNLRTP